jgi:putative SOS response-associated peptidase YedK
LEGLSKAVPRLVFDRALSSNVGERARFVTKVPVIASDTKRSETVAEKPMFRDSFKRSRCLICASGYYDWLATPEGKLPYYFTRRDGAVMTFAGLHSTWTDPKSKEAIQSCTMVITTPNNFVARSMTACRLF